MARNNNTETGTDVTSFGALYQRVSATGVSRPWGAPEGITGSGAAHRAQLVGQLLKLITPVLDLLQSEHRDGHLDPDDIETLNELQHWYSKLHAEVEHAHLPPDGGTPGTITT
ncbi:MAG: hypothetical protein QM767_15270 [Anaeromyxobacter sp.]